MDRSARCGVSLRDQLVAKGFASKKDARRVEQQLKHERKLREGHQRSAAEVRAEEEAARQAAREEVLRRKADARRAREAAREAAERADRVRQIARGNAVRSRGNVVFHHRAADGTHIARMQVSERVAWKLRCGEAAIVAVADARGGVEYRVVSADAAQRIEEIAPGSTVHRVRDTAGLAAPEERLLVPEWPMSLVPHKKR
jgi:uncharacterized protein YaiL (DUF2058 family)